MFRYALALTLMVGACSSSNGDAPKEEPTDGLPGRDGGENDGAPPADGGGGDGAAGDAGEDAGPPAVQLLGRWDMSNAQAPKTGWPGARIVVRFSGTGLKLKLSHANGSDGGNTWMNVIVDGMVKTPIEITGADQMVTAATGLASEAPHVVELEKRTEASWGVLTLSLPDVTFEGGGQLLPPPARRTRRIELLSDSTIDGFGVEGVFGDTATCNGAAPPQYDNVRKSMAWLTADALSAEAHILGQSGKGIARNEDGSTTDTYDAIYSRVLAENASSSWTFANFTPDVIVISLGGSDYANSPGPSNFEAAYKALVADLRTKYGAGPRIILLVWSQLKEFDGTRQAVTAAIDNVIADAANVGTKISRFTLPEADEMTDETGCEEHANAAHHQAMANLLVAEIKAKMGW
jgi:lysophospholipase L1-like esterase